MFSSVLFKFSSFFFFKQKTAYEMRISDWSSDVCSSDLVRRHRHRFSGLQRRARGSCDSSHRGWLSSAERGASLRGRSEEHTSELQSLMRISYAVFCLKKKHPKTQ